MGLTRRHVEVAAEVTRLKCLCKDRLGLEPSYVGCYLFNGLQSMGSPNPSVPAWTEAYAYEAARRLIDSS
jgi:hypothetical protein